MVKALQRLSNSRGLTIVAVMVLFLLVSTFLLLINRELVENRQDYLGAYQLQNQYYVHELAGHLSSQIQNGASDRQLVEYLKTGVATSNSRWFFLAKGSSILYAKNQSTTEGLGSLKNKNTFLKHMGAQQDILLHHVSFEESGVTYVVGVVTSKSGAFNLAAIPRHETFILLVCLSFAAIMFAIAMITISTVKRKNGKLKKAEEALVERNNQLNLLLKEDQEIQQILDCPREETKYYDDQVLETLLSKSTNIKLFPICLLGIYVVMKDKYYTKNQIFSYIEPIKPLLKPYHVLGEVARGEFVILLYRTSLEEAEFLKQQIYEIWETGYVARGLRVGAGIMEVDLLHETALETYQKFVANMDVASRPEIYQGMEEDENEIPSI
jgi:hypothetical protein